MIFIDDFLCDENNGITGWSNCQTINSKYHGPFTSMNIRNRSTMYREFLCNELSSEAIITFSTIFDCNVAFADELLFYINNELISSYGSASYDVIINDVLLKNISDCSWYIDRNITYTLNHLNQSFQLKFEALFKSNVLKNIVISDIKIDCIVPSHLLPTTSTLETTQFIEISSTMIDIPITTEYDTGIIDRDEILKCKRFYTNSNSKSNIARLSTMDKNFITFSEQHKDAHTHAEFRLSHFESDNESDHKSRSNRDSSSNEWYWNIRIELNKQQIVVQNKSGDNVIQTIFPSQFRLKDEDDCYLDITIDDKNNDLDKEELDVFWNCQSDNVAIWYFDNHLNKIHCKVRQKEYSLIWQASRNVGFEIGINEKNAKITSLDAGEFKMIETEDNNYRIAFDDTSRLYVDEECQLTKDEDQVS